MTSGWLFGGFFVCLLVCSPPLLIQMSTKEIWPQCKKHSGIIDRQSLKNWHRSIWSFSSFFSRQTEKYKDFQILWVCAEGSVAISWKLLLSNVTFANQVMPFITPRSGIRIWSAERQAPYTGVDKWRTKPACLQWVEHWAPQTTSMPHGLSPWALSKAPSTGRVTSTFTAPADSDWAAQPSGKIVWWFF